MPGARWMHEVTSPHIERIGALDVISWFVLFIGKLGVTATVLIIVNAMFIEVKANKYDVYLYI